MDNQEKKLYGKTANEINLEEIIANLPGHIYWKDTNCVLLGCNNNQARDTGLKSRDEIIGKTAYDLIYEDQSEEEKRKQATITDKADKAIMAADQQKTVEEFVVLPDKTKAYYLSVKVPLHDSNNKVVGLAGISLDITERKLAEEATKLAKEKAEAADQAKTNFIRDMGHDFRTPLAFIHGLSTTIQFIDEDSSIINQLDETITLLEQLDEESEAINKLQQLKNKLELEKIERLDQLLSIGTSCDRVLGFFKEILDYAKSASGVLTNDAKKTNIPELMNFLDELYAPGLRNKNINFQVDISESVPNELSFDQAKLKRILMNLLGNSIKFTDKGSITLAADYIKSDGKTGTLKIMVTDTAGGIPKDKLDVIFSSFTQLKSADRGRGGYGLGLSIVKNYLDLMGGTISIDSELGKGSCFTISVPVKTT